MKYFTLAQIQAQLLSNTLTCVELVTYYLEQIEKNKHLNAFVEIYDKEALQRAATLDQRIQKNPKQLGKLFGCVVSHKDMIVLKDHQVSASSQILNGFVSQFDASCLGALLAEDAIIIGRTNCDEFGMGSSNTNSFFGPVHNGAKHGYVSGGSSGGAAVSVQTDCCLLALGTDTGGSVRQPASLCGVLGFKPTYGLVSRYGLVAYASSFDQVGILARHISDLEIIMNTISESDDYDATMLDQKFDAQEGELPEQLKIAFLGEALENAALDSEIKDSIYGQFEIFRSQGISVEKVSFELLDTLVPCYYILTTAEASSNLSRYDGVRFGYRSKDSSNLNEMYVNSRTEGFGSEVKKRILLGSYVLSEAYYDAYFTKAQQVRALICSQLNNLFERYDFIMMPTSPKVAWPMEYKSSDPVEAYMADIYTVLANLAGLPAINVPLGNNSENLPFGIQVLAKRKADKKLLKFVQRYFE